MSTIYLEEAQEIQDQLVGWRRDLHRIPEIGLELPKTVKYVSEKLTLMGIKHEVKADISCIFATIGSGGKCILLRGDMDGLPGKEKSGEAFAADGDTFHGCGHDMHAATMLGVAALLKKHEAELPGTVKLLFQSGEETFQGAAAAIKAGILENPKVDAAYAMHAFAQYDLGTIIWNHLFMGAVYGFRITVKGIGGHGSQPERCADPIHAAVQIYQAYQELLARECPPQHAASLTIGHFAAGSAANVIPSEAVMEGTLRCFDPNTRALLIRRINELAPALANAFRCTAQIEELSNVPCNSNDPELTAACLESVKDLAANVMTEQYMGSEDFAFFAERIPACYLVIGAGVKDTDARFGQHNPRIRFNEAALPRAVACYVSVAIDWLNANR